MDQSESLALFRRETIEMETVLRDIEGAMRDIHPDDLVEGRLLE
jgi:hypothetical protein